MPENYKEYCRGIYTNTYNTEINRLTTEALAHTRSHELSEQKLNAIETMCYLIIANKLEIAQISIPSPFYPNETMDITIKANKNTKCTVDLVNGTPYITQRAAEATYTEEGKEQIRQNINYYLENAKIIKDGLEASGFKVYGGVNSPYIWLKIPEGMTSWEFFDKLLEEANVVGTPGSGFGPHGEGYFRLTAFNTKENTIEAVERIKNIRQ